MYISTEISCMKEYGSNFEIIKLLKDSGFDAYDFSMFTTPNRMIYDEDYIEQAKDLRQYADEIGIVCNQTHGPFPSALKNNEEYNNQIIPYIIRALEVSAILGAKICVVHPCNDYNAEENAELYFKLIPLAESLNVKIATENMWNWDLSKGHAISAACSHHDDFLKHVLKCNSEYLVACVDIGHAAMKGLETDPYTMITTLGNKYVQAIHLHDNDGHHDSHTLPYAYGGVNFDEVIRALKDINYTGDITLEASYFAKKFPVELYPACAKIMAETANSFRKKVFER